MDSFVSFFNKSSYPSISVWDDGALICDTLIKGKESKYHTCCAGSASFTIKQNTEKSFLSLWVSLKPQSFNTLIIEDDTAFLS